VPILAVLPALVLSAGPARAAADGGPALLSLCLASQPATGPANLWTSWSLAPEVVLPLLLVLGLYGRGLMTLRRSGTSGVRPWQAICFAAGWLTLVVALVSPLCRMAAALASAHMVQHVILVAIAPPLLVLAAPMAALVHGLPRRWRAALASGVDARLVQITRRSLGAPITAGLLYGAAIWLWHSPLLYQAALLGAGLHLLMYAVLIAAGLLFWRPLVATAWPESGGHGGAMLSALATTIHTGLLGALLTFAPVPWYPLLTPRVAAWGLSALEDQQLAGLIMWVPMGLIYVVSSVCLMAAWLSVIERRHPAGPDLELYRRAAGP
jgi:cytochrome c oxidase assembly factor CtaG